MSQDTQTEMQMDIANLYREDTYTDRKLGVIRCMTPVSGDGSRDASRTILYLGRRNHDQMARCRLTLKSRGSLAKRWRLLRFMPSRQSNAPCNKFRRCVGSRPSQLVVAREIFLDSKTGRRAAAAARYNCLKSRLF